MYNVSLMHVHKSFLPWKVTRIMYSSVCARVGARARLCM